MLSFNSEKHAIGNDPPPVSGIKISKEVLVKWYCGSPVSVIRFEDLNVYFGFWGNNEISDTESKNATDNHYQCRTGSVLTLIQE